MSSSIGFTDAKIRLLALAKNIQTDPTHLNRKNSLQQITFELLNIINGVLATLQTSRNLETKRQEHTISHEDHQGSSSDTESSSSA